MEYKNINEIAKALHGEEKADYDAVKAFFAMTDIHPDTIIPFPTIDGINTTLMELACDAADINMVGLLFSLGSDPNFTDHNWVCPAWHLQYSRWNDSDKIDEQRIAILKMFIDKGLDPMLRYEDEALLSYVNFAFFENPDAHRCVVLELLENSYQAKYGNI